MIFHEGMGPRQSIAHELLDTLFFGNLDRHTGTRYRKVNTVPGKDAYMIPFARSKACFGAIMVHSPSRIEVFYNVKGEKAKAVCKSLYDTKRFMIRNFLA